MIKYSHLTTNHFIYAMKLDTKVTMLSYVHLFVYKPSSIRSSCLFLSRHEKEPFMVIWG